MHASLSQTLDVCRRLHLTSRPIAGWCVTASITDLTLEVRRRFDEAPPVLQFNKYVRSGYRAGMSPRQCLCSMFQYHNEIGAQPA